MRDSLLDEAGQRSMVDAIKGSHQSYCIGLKCYAAFWSVPAIPCERTECNPFRRIVTQCQYSAAVLEAFEVGPPLPPYGL